MTALAAVCAALSVWLLVPGWSQARVRYVGPDRTPAHGERSRGAVLAGWARLRGWVRWSASGRRAAARERMRVVHALNGLAAELQAGQPASMALQSADDSSDVWPFAMAAARAGDDIADALMVDAQRSDVLAHLAACWRVSMAAGTGLADVVGQLAASARTAEDVRVRLEAELAGPRATARTLAVLPLAGMGLGTLMGAEPIGWLLATMAGRACLAGGLVLTGVGYWWTGRIAARVEAML